MGNRRDNTGKPYEILVQAIFQAIHDQEEVATLIVERNKTLQGKTTPHQIDVYWKFEKGGIPYEAIVQAKDWRSRVKLGQLLEFSLVRRICGCRLLHWKYRGHGDCVSKPRCFSGFQASLNG